MTFFAPYVLVLASGVAVAQAPPQAPAGPPVVSVVLGPRSIKVTEYYTLSFQLRGAALQQYSAFPELDGFKKSGRTSTTTTRLVQGRSFSELTITQRYAPYGEGEFAIKPFQLTVNGRAVRSAGGRVRVGPIPSVVPGTAPVPNAAASVPAGPPVASAPGTGAPAATTPAAAVPAIPNQAPAVVPPAAVGSLDQLLGKPKPALYTEPEDHAFLALVAERPQIVVGEGVRVGLYFYLTPGDQALLAFHDFTTQLPALVQQLRQPGAWQMPVQAASVAPDSVRRGQQLYLRYRLAESTYYPLTTTALTFPAMSLTMTKFRLLKKFEPNVDNRLATLKSYRAAGLTVQVRALPAAPTGVPAGAGVAVGEYQLTEQSSTRRPRVGQSFTYTLRVQGRGNLAALTAPTWQPRAGLDVYGPQIREDNLPDGSTRKTFRYRLVAHHPGALPLDSLLQLTTYDPRQGRYTVLKPELKPVVLGKDTAPVQASRPEEDPFYGPALAVADDTVQDLDVYGQVRQAAGYLVLAVFGIALFGWWRGRQA